MKKKNFSLPKLTRASLKNTFAWADETIRAIYTRKNKTRLK